MAFSITCMRQHPDVGFRSVSRHTPMGACQAGVEMLTQGGIEVEIRDDRGILRSLNEIGRDGRDQLDEGEILARLAPY